MRELSVYDLLAVPYSLLPTPYYLFFLPFTAQPADNEKDAPENPVGYPGIPDTDNPGAKEKGKHISAQNPHKPHADTGHKHDVPDIPGRPEGTGKGETAGPYNNHHNTQEAQEPDG